MNVRARVSIKSFYFEYEGEGPGAMEALKILQGNLFLNNSQAHHAEMEKIPIARHADPDTSKAAAKQITDSGVRGEQHRTVLTAVQACPGKTSRELAAEAGLDRYMVARRLPELEKMGVVQRETERMCTIGKLSATTWRPAICTESTTSTATKKICPSSHVSSVVAVDSAVNCGRASQVPIPGKACTENEASESGGERVDHTR
jgi:hypothetical protein